MNLVYQIDGNTCQQACAAMIANVDIDVILLLVGKQRMGEMEWMKLREALGFKMRDGSIIVDSSFQVGSSLSNLARKFRTLLCSVTDIRAPHEYQHAVLIHDRMMYDPWAGTNPHWPWSRVIWSVRPVGDDCMNDFKGF